MVNRIFIDSTRTAVGKNVAVLFVLALVALAWGAAPLTAFASPNKIIGKAPITRVPDLSKNSPKALLVGKLILGTDKIAPATVKSLKTGFVAATYQGKIREGLYYNARKGVYLIGTNVTAQLVDPPKKAISSTRTILCKRGICELV